jgi:hypothetical protein
MCNMEIMGESESWIPFAEKTDYPGTPQHGKIGRMDHPYPPGR